MSAPRHICPCFRCGEHLYERPHLAESADKTYRLQCPKCGQHVTLNADNYGEAFDLFKVMFAGQTFYDIEDLTEDDGFVLGYRHPVEEPPDITHLCDTDFDEGHYTHFAYLPIVRWVERNGKIQPYKYGEER